MTRSSLRTHRSRWRNLRGAVALVATLGLAAGSMAACATGTGGGSSTDQVKDTIRLGVPGGSTGTVLDPHVLTDGLNTWFDWAFFETLGNFDEEGNYYNVLAESFTPNADATSWTMVLKDGITFHNGNPLTADDVIFTFTRVLDPATAATAFGTASDIASMTKVDDKTVQFDLVAPRGSFPELLSDGSTMGIIPTDFDPANPVSTGPWVFGSYDPGVEIKLTRYDGYHGERAKFREFDMVALPDNDARVNALISGAIDVDGQMQAANLPQVEGNPNLTVLDTPSGAFFPITMRVDQGPFADPRVREALRLAVDREQVVTVVYGGKARIGNDLYGIDDPDYRDDLVREHDVEKAKQLIAEAGVAGTPATLYTISTVEPTANIVAAAAREIGLDATVEVRDDAVFYSDGYLEYDWAVDQWPASSILNVASLTDGPNAMLNYTHFSDSEYNALYDEASATTDPAVKKEALGKMQQILFDRGGFLIPAFGNLLHVVPTNTTGWATIDPKGGILFIKSFATASWT